MLLTLLFSITAFKPLGNGPSVNGQGTLNLPYMNGEAQHFAFHANTSNSGVVSGSFESNRDRKSVV